MRRIPYGLQTFARESYYAALANILSWLELELDRETYPTVMIVSRKGIGFLHKAMGDKHIIVAQIMSDLPIGETDDNCMEFNPGGYRRCYDGLRIHIIDEKYHERINDFILIASDLFNRRIELVEEEVELKNQL
jgi:hypothetical protein